MPSFRGMPFGHSKYFDKQYCEEYEQDEPKTQETQNDG